MACMKRFLFALSLLVLSSALSALAQDAPKPAIVGYITAITSKTAFDVNGWHVVTTPQTEYTHRAITKEGQTDTTDLAFAGKFQLGDSVQIFGSKNSSEAISAAKVLLIQKAAKPVHGTAVIQSVQQNSSATILEADGYRISIAPDTCIEYGAHLRKGTSISPGMWVQYAGKLDSRGGILADCVKISKFSLTSLRRKLQQFGSKVWSIPKPEEHVRVSKEIQSMCSSDTKTTEDRVQKIGMRLIPVFQKNLAAENPQKINFQFCLLDDDYLFIPIATQDGHIGLSKHVVDMLQNDDQVAAVLANGVAQVLEWQRPRYDEVQLSGEGQAETFLVGLLVPAIINVFQPSSYDATTNSEEATINWNNALSAAGKQKARVALSLMQDAGYDVHQAPIAWQRIGAQYPKKSTTKLIPQESIYLVRVIAREYIDASSKQIATNTSAPVHP
jgi:hypothetical protein